MTSQNELRDIPLAVIARFWSKVDKTSSCWQWQVGMTGFSGRKR